MGLRTSVNQEKRSRNTRTINVQSLMASVGESQVADITPVVTSLIFAITQSRLVKSINRNVMLLQQILSAVVVASDLK